MKKKKFSFDLQRFAGVNTVRDKLINFEVFKGGNRKLGMADVTLPDINYKTATISGAGIGADGKHGDGDQLEHPQRGRDRTPRHALA